jgi:hypothetical protein
MGKINSVVIYKPTEHAVFEVGAKLMRGKDKTDVDVKEISVNFFNTVSIALSDGVVLKFKGFPISIEIK